MSNTFPSNFINTVFLKFSKHLMKDQEAEILITVHTVLGPSVVGTLSSISSEIPDFKNRRPLHTAARVLFYPNLNSISPSTTLLENREASICSWINGILALPSYGNGETNEKTTVKHSIQALKQSMSNNVYPHM